MFFVVDLLISPFKKIVHLYLPIDLSFALVLPYLFLKTLEILSLLSQSDSNLKSKPERQIAIENTTCQCRTAFPHDDLTSYF